MLSNIVIRAERVTDGAWRQHESRWWDVDEGSAGAVAVAESTSYTPRQLDAEQQGRSTVDGRPPASPSLSRYHRPHASSINRPDRQKPIKIDPENRQNLSRLTIFITMKSV